jgi:hypothetical protein
MKINIEEEEKYDFGTMTDHVPGRITGCGWDDDSDTAVMILSRIDLEIQGIGRPRNQSKDQSSEEEYRAMMRRLSGFIHSAKLYHKSLQNLAEAKQKVGIALRPS